MQWLSEFLKYDFMKNALAAILIITPLFGILGTMIVNNKLAFFSDALGHSAFTGMAAGIILGVTNQGLSMVIFGICFALLLNYIRRRGSVSNDTVISVFSSVSTAAGLRINDGTGLHVSPTEIQCILHHLCNGPFNPFIVKESG